MNACNMTERQAADLIRACQAMLVAIDCGGHEKALNKSNLLCVEFMRNTLAAMDKLPPVRG